MRKEPYQLTDSEKQKIFELVKKQVKNAKTPLQSGVKFLVQNVFVVEYRQKVCI